MAKKQFGGGRSGERQATGLTEQLVSLGFESGRMKTGTPPRIDGRSIDYSKTEEQGGDIIPGKFFIHRLHLLYQNKEVVYITYTNQKVHDVLQTGFEKSPMFQGRIKGLGPRYCPSIEDKINTVCRTRKDIKYLLSQKGWKYCRNLCQRLFNFTTRRSTITKH